MASHITGLYWIIQRNKCDTDCLPFTQIIHTFDIIHWLGVWIMISVSGNSASDTSQYTNAQHTQIKGKNVFKYTPFNYWNWIIDNKRSKQQPSHDPQRVHEYPNDNCCNYLILVLFWFIFISFIEKCCRKQKHVNAFKSAPEQRNLPTTLLDLFKEPGAWNTHISFTIFSGFEINDWCDCKNTAPC